MLVAKKRFIKEEETEQARQAYDHARETYRTLLSKAEVDDGQFLRSLLQWSSG